MIIQMHLSSKILQRQLFIFAPFLRRQRIFGTAYGGKTAPQRSVGNIPTAAAMYAAERPFGSSLLLSYARRNYLLQCFLTALNVDKNTYM